MSEVDLIEDDGEIEDEIEDDNVIPLRYNISSYGADYDTEGIVRRLKRKEILIPEFQRSYVWSLPEASRFVESLLLGSPIPGVFLAVDQETNKFLVIDGQQRLQTLRFFYDKTFNPKLEEKSHRVFMLNNVQQRFEGRTYDDLEDRDRLKLDNSVIHATIVRQDSPPGDDTSMYHIFERLNNGGRRLTEQEIRCAIYHGALIDAIRDINDYPAWRNIFGQKQPRLKDQELILRFLALYYNADTYQKPMKDFLNKFLIKKRQGDQEFINRSRMLFQSTIDLIWEALQRRAFRPERALNAAVFDSVMVGLARRMQTNESIETNELIEAYNRLLSDDDYINAISQSTADEASVASRIDKTTKLFSEI